MLAKFSWVFTWIKKYQNSKLMKFNFENTFRKKYVPLFLMNVAGGHTATSFRIEDCPFCFDWVLLAKLNEGFSILVAKKCGERVWRVAKTIRQTHAQDCCKWIKIRYYFLSALDRGRLRVEKNLQALKRQQLIVVLRVGGVKSCFHIPPALHCVFGIADKLCTTLFLILESK